MVYSTSNRGTTPITSPAFMQHDPSPQAGSFVSSSAGCGVLVVDDDNAIRDSLNLMLSDEGYAVTQAADGVEALRVLRGASAPLVVLLDIQMPRLNGEEVLREVLRDEQLQTGSVFIVITANRYALSSAFREVLARYQIPVLDKPLDLDVLLASVARAQHCLPWSPRISG